MVERAELTTILSAEGKSQNWASFPLRTKANYLEVQLPPESELWSAELDGKRLKPQREDQSVLIGLPGGAASKTARTLRIAYQTPVPSVSLAGKVNMVLRPSSSCGASGIRCPADVPLAGLVWRLHLPSGYEVVRTGGTVVDGRGPERRRPARSCSRGGLCARGRHPSVLRPHCGGQARSCPRDQQRHRFRRAGRTAAGSASRGAGRRPAAQDETGPVDLASTDGTAARGKGEICAIRLSPASPAEKKIEDALKSPTSWSSSRRRLTTWSSTSKLHHIDIQLDKKAVDEASIGHRHAGHQEPQGHFAPLGPELTAQASWS